MWDKSLVDESDPYYLGTYAGAASEPVVRRAIEDAPVLVLAGVQFTDLNSGFFTQQITHERTIELAPSVASVGAATFAPVAMDAALRCLTTLVTAMRGRSPGSPGAPLPGALPPADRSDAEAPNRAEALSQVEPLSQVALWSAVAEFLRPGDIVLADQGTAFYGMATHRLPRDVTFIGQPLWASIGYTLPALLGACLGATSAPDTFTLITAVMPRMDVPVLLSTLARAASNANARPDQPARLPVP